MFTNFTNEIVYSPSNIHLENLFGIVSEYVRPFLNINSVKSSDLLAPRLSQANSYVGVEFPDWYAVSFHSIPFKTFFTKTLLSQNLTALPDNLTYSLRFPGELRRTGGAMNPLWFNWRTDFLFPLFQPGGARNWGQIHDGVPAGYYIEGK